MSGRHALAKAESAGVWYGRMGAAGELIYERVIADHVRIYATDLAAGTPVITTDAQLTQHEATLVQRAFEGPLYPAAPPL